MDKKPVHHQIVVNENKVSCFVCDIGAMAGKDFFAECNAAVRIFPDFIVNKVNYF